MSTILMIFLTMSSLTFYFMESPIIILLNLIFQTFLICCFLKLILSTSWFSLILFLIFIGGLMVMFLYITSLAANNIMMNLNTTTYILFLLTFMISTTFIFIHIKHTTIHQENFNLTDLIFKIYSSLNQFMIIMIMLYLLLVLLICVNIILTDSGPLRTFNQTLNIKP